MRFKLKRIASTLLFGLACSIITALHISSSKELPNGEPFNHQSGELRRPRDHKFAWDSYPVLPGPIVPNRQQVHEQKQAPGVRLQREMAWAVDDSSLGSVSLQQQQPEQPKKVDSSNKTLLKHSALLASPFNADTGKTIQKKSGSQTVQVLQHNGTTLSKEGSFFQTELSDIFIGVKTTGAYHKNRVKLILETWLPLAKKQTYFFTDQEDPYYQQILGDHLINTKCPSLHSRQALCCKVAIIYDTFLDSGKRWFCHLDDDNYLNVLNLVKLLQSYNHQENLYLGRASLTHPIQALDRDTGYKETSFWFATGGAGFCISRSLALKMVPLASGGRFPNVCNRVRLPDDVSIGFVIDGLLKVPLTKLNVFNSHLQGLNLFEEANLQHQVTLSYYISASRNNTITLKDAAFTKEQDPTRMRSLHCKLYPNTSMCS